MKRKKAFSILSIIFTALALTSFILGLFDFIYIINLEKGLTSILIGLYFAFFAFVLLFLVMAFGVLGSVFSALALKIQGVKALHITTLAVSSALAMISIGLAIFIYYCSHFG